jgi:hypothetical protein
MQIEKSETMTKLSGIEDSLIRMPEMLRKQINVDLGSIIIVKNLPLQVNKVFKNDKIDTFLKAFVSENIIKKLCIQTHALTVEKHITLGCDPELFLVDRDTNKLYNPGFLVKKTAQVGYDGMLAELRPDPDVDPCKVVDNLYKLIEELHTILINKNLHTVSMLARSSGWGLSAGFHIHLGIPKQLLDPTTPNYIKILRVIIKALDYYVGTLAVLIENTDFTRRCNPLVAYGKVGDFRVDNRTLEYRVPGGALLRHPELTKGLLSVASLVTHDVIERIRLFTDDFVREIDNESKLVQHIYPNLIDTQYMFSLLCSPNISRAEKEYETIKQDLCYMVNYDYYKEALNCFTNLINIEITDDIWLNWSKKNV